MPLEGCHLYVSGKVQGVGFRYATLRIATSLGLVGWVRNTVDERVEIEAEGSSDAIEKLLQWCQRGPASATVSEVQIITQASRTALQFDSFKIL